MFCKNCGKELPEGSTVCFECGAPQNTNVVSTQPRAVVQTTQPAIVKNKALAAILALFLGGWGANDFYLGYTKTGILKIVLTIVSFGVIGGIWGLIDFFRIICGQVQTDAKGNPVM